MTFMSKMDKKKNIRFILFHTECFTLSLWRQNKEEKWKTEKTNTHIYLVFKDGWKIDPKQNCSQLAGHSDSLVHSASGKETISSRHMSVFHKRSLIHRHSDNNLTFCGLSNLTEDWLDVTGSVFIQKCSFLLGLLHFHQHVSPFIFLLCFFFRFSSVSSFWLIIFFLGVFSYHNFYFWLSQESVLFHILQRTLLFSHFLVKIIFFSSYFTSILNWDELMVHIAMLYVFP